MKQNLASKTLMKMNRLIGTIALSLTSFSLLAGTSSPARSEPVGRSLYDCSSAVSLIMTPDGRCHDLTYLSLRGQSRASLEAATQNFSDAFDSLSRDSISYTQGVGDVYSTRTVSDNPTEDEKAIRRRTLLNAGGRLGEAAATNQTVEDLTFVMHLRMLHELSGAFANQRTVSPLTLQRLGLAK